MWLPENHPQWVVAKAVGQNALWMVSILNTTMCSDPKEISERIVVKEIKARMRFGIWHLLQCVLAKVTDDHNALWQMPIAKTGSGILYPVSQRV